MGMNLIQKIIKQHLVSGEMIAGEGIALKIDQTLTQDATGTMAYLEFEAMGIPKVKTELSISYVDHSMMQASFENADDQLFLKTVAAKYGLAYSKPGNGICHQVHLERFGAPGKTLVGSDSHTPTGGGIGMLAIGAGGLDVACCMAGLPFQIKMPKVVNVVLEGKLRPWVSAKDIILEMLRRLSVKGGVNKAFEYTGPGAATLTIPERSTITNMGTELGATTSIFASDEVTRQFLKAQGREESYTPLCADPDAEYDETIVIDLSALEPLIACPNQPDQVVTVKSLKGMPVPQICICSCTNTSYLDLVKVAKILKGRMVHPDTQMSVSPGSRQVLEMLARDGYLADIVASGVRILECSCGPCGGSGMAPSTGSVTIRTSNRNFMGRSGTKDAKVFLAGCETCAATAIKGCLTDASAYADVLHVEPPEQFYIDDRMILLPPANSSNVEVIKGPNIKGLPEFNELEDRIEKTVTIKVGDNISTDHIIPAQSNIVKLRSNLPAISMYLFSRMDSDFSARTIKRGGGIIVGGENYGQGSSREHAALAPKYLNIKAVLVKSFARIHMQNLVNFGILPIVFDNPADYDQIEQDDILIIENIKDSVIKNHVVVRNATKNIDIVTHHVMSPHHVELVLEGGLLRYIQNHQND